MPKPAIEQSAKINIPDEVLPLLRWANADNLTCRQAAILRMIEHNPGCTVGAIAHVMNVPKPAVTRAADKLSDWNLIHRRAEPADLRLVQLWPGRGKGRRK